MKIFLCLNDVSFFVRKIRLVFTAFLMIFIGLFTAVYGSVNYQSNANVYSNSNNVSFNYTTSANDSRILVFSVGILSGSSATQISSVTYAGLPMTKVLRDARTDLAAEVWYLLNPPSGTAQVNVRQATAARKVMGVCEYFGASGIGAANSNKASSSSITTNLTTTQAGSRIAGIYTQRNNWNSMTFTPVTPGLTARWNRQASYWLTYIRGLHFDMPAPVQGANNVTYNSNRANSSVMITVELKAAVPFVTTCAPSVGHTGGGQQVTVTGGNFENGCSVSFGGTPAASVTFVNSRTLNVITPARSAGVVNVVVANPDGLSGTGTGIYTYSSSPAPVVSSALPSSGSTLGGQDITVSGLNFVNGCTVTIGGLTPSAFSFINSSTLSLKTPANSAGIADIRVVNPDTQSSVLAGGYTYVLPAPLPEYCTPASGLTAGGQEITIKGRYFVNGCTVTIGGVNAGGLVFVDTMTIRVTAPANPAGAANVAVRNSDTQTGTLLGGYTYYNLPAPVVSSIYPASGSTAGGQSVTVSGLNFVSGCTAAIGGLNASVVFISSSLLALTTPPNTAGVKDVSVTNPDMQSSVLINGYTYALPPVVTLCSPSVGPVTGGRSVTVTGQNFRSGCSLFVDGTPAAVTRVSSTQLLFTTPPHAEGSVGILVQNTDFTQATLASGYFYDGTPPVITLNGGGADVTVAAGGVYSEAAAASDNHDGNITGLISKMIYSASGVTVAAVSTSALQVFTISYNVSDSSGNPAVEQTRLVRITDQTPPVITLNGGGADVTILTGTAYAEAATASDNIDGNITHLIVREIRDSGNNVVASVSTDTEETYTITYDVSDLSLNAALQRTRVLRVVDRQITAIEVVTPPDKVKYKTGESIDITGLEVMATFDDMTTSMVSVAESDIAGFNSALPQAGQEITVTIAGFSDTFGVDIIGLASISVIATPSKTVYDINEPFDMTGLSVIGTYTDASTEPVNVAPADISGFDSSSPAVSRQLTVSYAGLEDYFSISVVPSLASISVTALPLKTVYDISEPFAITGLAVTGYYTDGSQQLLPVNAGHISGFDSSSVETDQILTVTYSGRQAFFSVDIITTLVSIAITTPASKTVFNTGDALTIDGMVVTGTYTDGSKKIETVTTADVSGFNSSVPVTGQVLTVTVGGKTASYTIDVVQPLLVSIAVTVPASKLIYSIGEALDITGLVVSGTYDDASIKVLPVTAAHISGFDSSAPDFSQTLTVTYGGKSTAYNISVRDYGPVVSDCFPDAGPNGGGTSVTVSGAFFTAGCVVTIGGAAATSVVFVDEFTITAVTPPGSGGFADIRVTNPDGQSDTGEGLFFYTGATATHTRTPAVTPSMTATASSTATRSPTRTITMTATISATHTVSPTFTPTSTATPTMTVTQTHTNTPTFTATPTITMTATSTPGYGDIESGKTRVFPQPADEEIAIEYGLDEDAEVTIIIFNAGAIKVAEKAEGLSPAGSSLSRFDVTRYAPGVYYYLVRAKTLSGREIKFPVNKFLVAR